MRKFLMTILAAFVVFNLYSGNYKLSEINIRDPFILTDTVEGRYYMYRTSDSIDSNGKIRGGVEVFMSRDLENWEGPKTVMRIPDGNALTGTVWAPEVHAYNGQYYLFATINSDIKWKKSQPGWGDFTLRGTQIFHSTSPEGPFVPFDKFPHTPDMMALDGTLWVEDGKPYMVYCHEWVELGDGTMELIELTPDLSKTIVPSKVLFNGSAPEWSTGMQPSPGSPRGYVTDGCYLYRTGKGKLLMIWSSFGKDGYAIGIAESATGSVKGPWIQHEKPFFPDNGGHGMIFKTLSGDLCLILHQPNDPLGAEREHIYPLEDTGDTLMLKSKSNHTK